MPLSALSTRDAVLQAMLEYDELGRDAFLEKHRYGRARDYFVVHDGKRYDSKAIAGVAVGKQFPEEGPLSGADFSGGDATVRAKLEQLGFEVEGPDGSMTPKITSRDVELIRLSRGRDRYASLSTEEHEAYERVHSALGQLARIAQTELGTADYEIRLTSGFHIRSGVRGAIPKDLWFGAFRRENAAAFLGNPQLFAIVSGRGVEIGFYLSTHPSDFSNTILKARLREAAPTIYAQLPEPGSDSAAEMERRLAGRWEFRRKSRLEPHQSEFPDLSNWLRHFKSPAGAAEGGGGITRWITGDILDSTDLGEAVREMVQVFRPLMDSIRARGADREPLYRPPAIVERSLESLFGEMLTELEHARKQPFQTLPVLWGVMDQIQARLENLRAVARRPDIFVNWSLGAGNWANVPWLALLNRNITTSTQSGIYVVLLIAEDLSAIYATLIQGMTDLVNELGRPAAVRTLVERSESYQAQLGELGPGITLGNDVDLKTASWRAKNYEVGTIAYARFDRSAFPTDERFEEVVERLLSAYDRIADVSSDAIEEVAPPPGDPALLPVEEDPYSIDDAMSGLFMARAEVERILTIWRTKKNIILQGAPGVGKTFVAKRLAFALMGYQAPSRVETVQFHQSYAYEDFVQGYRPTPGGGFELRDGVFKRFCQAAIDDPGRNYVLIIDEINRGNLSKIFGELMLLIEQDKRTPSWATRLTYAKADEPKFYVPENLYVIGMMNTADRSLSMVDYALRRRFAFVPLVPQFTSPAFREQVVAAGVPAAVVDRVMTRMTELNGAISTDKLNLGPGFQIGHSFFVPTGAEAYLDGWYERIIDTEIRPLLEEYWADEGPRASEWLERLLAP